MFCNDCFVHVFVCVCVHTVCFQEEEDLYLKIYEYSEAVIHLESSHTRIPAQTTSDREMTTLLHRYTTCYYACMLMRDAGGRKKVASKAIQTIIKTKPQQIQG